MKEPGPNHPITIVPHPGRVRITADGVTIAESTSALTLTEAGYAPVLYLPREDARTGLLRRSPKTTTCPYKGEASYFDVVIDGATRAAAVWSYEHPFPAVARVLDHLAFYPHMVVVEER